MYTFIYLSSQLDSEFEVLNIPPSTFRKIKQMNWRSLYMYLSFVFQMWELAALVLSSFILLANCQGGMDRRKLDTLISYPPIKILYMWIDLLLCSCCLIFVTLFLFQSASLTHRFHSTARAWKRTNIFLTTKQDSKRLNVSSLNEFRHLI